MKKIVLVSLLLVGSMFANEAGSSIKVLNKDYKTTKELMSAMKQELPTAYATISDYFTAKTCSKNFNKKVTIKQIRDFSATIQFGTLIALKYQNDNHLAKAHYYLLIDGYKFMNCGDDDVLDNIFGSTSISRRQNND